MAAPLVTSLLCLTYLAVYLTHCMCYLLGFRHLLLQLRLLCQLGCLTALFQLHRRYSCEHMTQVHLFHNHGGVLSGNTVKGEGYW